MDYPDEDWVKQEQITCDYLEDGKGCNGNVRWIFEKGLSLANKFVITGVVMSSAPLVLPQILLVSAVGFAFSLPLGLVYTGYACTLNLISKLLPMPTEFPMLEYDQMFHDEMKEVGGGDVGEYRIEHPHYMENEEKEQTNDLRSRVEERIELLKNENEAPPEEVDSEGIRRDDELRMDNENGGYEEDDDETLVGNNESSVEMVGRSDMGQNEFVNQEREQEALLPKQDALKSSDRINFREETGPTRKDSKDEEVKPEVGKEENIEAVENVVEECCRNQAGVNNEEEDIKRGSVGLLEKIREEGNADDAAKKTNNKKKNNKKKMTIEGRAETALPNVKNQTAISKNLTENQESEPKKRKNLEYNGEAGMQQLPVGEAVGSNDLISLQENITTSYPLGESEETSGRHTMGIGNINLVEISVIASRPEASYRDTEEEFVDEKKIWEQIDALRTIVGYKATPHRSSVEEVKALYVFAGVELPVAFGNEADLAEISNKLRFLMSIVGVK